MYERGGVYFSLTFARGTIDQKASTSLVVEIHLDSLVCGKRETGNERQDKADGAQVAGKPETQTNQKEEKRKQN